LGPISATDIMPLGPLEACGSDICALVDISALAIIFLDPLLIRCRFIEPLLNGRQRRVDIVDVGGSRPTMKSAVKTGSGK
jgi:hypothetical protein